MTTTLDFAALWPFWPQLLAGLWTTVTLTILATIGGVSLGILGAALRSGKPTLASHIWGRMSSLFVIRRSWCSSFLSFSVCPAWG
jgi:ABC-type amino acid transport system permease subunit